MTIKNLLCIQPIFRPLWPSGITPSIQTIARSIIPVLAGALMVFLSGCSIPQVTQTPSPVRSTSRPYVIKNCLYVPQKHFELMQTGIASYYGGKDGFHGAKTASGERFNMFQLSAAHKTLPLPSMIMVENLENGKKLVLRVNDRGPFSSRRILDVSVAAARRLGFYHKGYAKVRIYTLVDESLKMPENRPGFCKKKNPHQEQGNLSLYRYYIQVPCGNKKGIMAMKKTMSSWGRTHIQRSGGRHCIWIGPYSTQLAASQVCQRIPKGYVDGIVCQHSRKSRNQNNKRPIKNKKPAKRVRRQNRKQAKT